MAKPKPIGPRYQHNLAVTEHEEQLIQLYLSLGGKIKDALMDGVSASLQNDDRVIYVDGIPTKK